MQKNRAGKDVSDGSFQKKMAFFPFLEDKKLTFTTSMQTFAETFVIPLLYFPNYNSNSLKCRFGKFFTE